MLPFLGKKNIENCAYHMRHVLQITSSHSFLLDCNPRGTTAPFSQIQAISSVSELPCPKPPHSRDISDTISTAS